jgi:hypothetical protein
MEKVYEHITTEHGTNFYLNFNSLDPKEAVDEIFGEKYFSTAKSMGTAKHPHFEYDDSQPSSKDEKVFEENYGNPLCSVTFQRRILTIEKSDEKVSIKLFYYARARKVGKPYFIKKTSLYFLTYNYKTNSLYIGSLVNYHLKRKCVKQLRRGSLCDDPVQRFKNKIGEYFNDVIFGHSVTFGKYDTDLPIKIFIDSIPNIKEFDEELKYTLYKHILVTGGVKLPNNWKTLINVYPQPKKTDYKKVGFKYIEALMEMRDMKGDKLKRVLHKVDHFNMASYDFAVKLFGLDFILSKPDEDIELILSNKCIYAEYTYNIDFTKTELKNVYSIYKLVSKGELDYLSFFDHLNFKTKITKHQTIKWKSKTIDEFNDEHVEWSELISSYTDGTITRRYSREFIEKIQEVISINDEEYYPVVLTTSNEYINESVVQSNCVRTYIDRPDCFIISLRKGGSVGNERLTNEFSMSIVKEKLKLNRVQTKAKRNTQPDITWSDALDILDNKVKRLNEKGLFSLPEKDVVYKLGMPKHSKAIIYNNQLFSNIIWDDATNNDWFDFAYNDDDLPL